MRFISWNVNGLRSALRKGFGDWLAAGRPDVLCVQEARALPEEVEGTPWPQGYQTHWHCAEKRGYSGVVTFLRETPRKVTRGMGIATDDCEGRVLTVELPEFFLVNAYVPNSQRSLARLPYRQKWDLEFLAHLRRLDRRKPVVVCGDFNVAHQARDLANPKANVRNHGFTVEERGGFDALVQAGFVDTFREFESGGGHYTWWSQMSGARARNVGWRIDYFLISQRLRPALKRAFIQRDVMGSDHCPVGIELDL